MPTEVYQQTITRELNWILKAREKSTKDQKGVTLLAKLGRVRLILRNISLDGIHAKVFAVTGTVFYDGEDQDACWLYDNLSAAWGRFFEAALVDLRSEFTDLAYGLCTSNSLTTAAMKEEMPKDGGLGRFAALEELGEMIDRWENRLIADDYTRVGMPQQAEEIKKNGRNG